MTDSMPALIAAEIDSYDQVLQRAIKAEQELAAAEAQNKRIRDLFNGGPDTSCRTVWDDGVECVSVPLDDLRAALGGES